MSLANTVFFKIVTELIKGLFCPIHLPVSGCETFFFLGNLTMYCERVTIYIYIHTHTHTYIHTYIHTVKYSVQLFVYLGHREYLLLPFGFYKTQ